MLGVMAFKWYANIFPLHRDRYYSAWYFVISSEALHKCHNIFDEIPRYWFWREDYWYFHKILTQWDFCYIIISSVELTTQWIKSSIRGSRTGRELHKFTGMEPFKPGKYNTHPISQYYNLLNLKVITVSHTNCLMLIYCPSQTSSWKCCLV